MSKPKSDTDRILELLERGDWIDTFFLRSKGFSGNPSQRIRDLKDRGYAIETKRFTREYDGRRGAKYRLIPDAENRLFV